MVWIGLIAVIVAAEYWIKGYIEKTRDFKQQTSLCNGHIVIQKYHNKGVALNVFENHGKIVKIVTGTMIGLMLVFLGMLIKEKRSKWVTLGVALLLGGAISNWIDRMEKGYVVDYFRFDKVKKLKHIVFNLADIFIFIGGFFIVLGEVLSKDN